MCVHDRTMVEPYFSDWVAQFVRLKMFTFSVGIGPLGTVLLLSWWQLDGFPCHLPACQHHAPPEGSQVLVCPWQWSTYIPIHQMNIRPLQKCVVKKYINAFHQMLWDDHFPTKRGMWWRKKDESGFTYSTNDRPWSIPFLIPSPHPNSFHNNLLRMRLIAYTDYNAIMLTPILGDHFVSRRGMGVRGTRTERETPPTGG